MLATSLCQIHGHDKPSDISELLDSDTKEKPNHTGNHPPSPHISMTQPKIPRGNLREACHEDCKNADTLPQRIVEAHRLTYGEQKEVEIAHDIVDASNNE